MALKSVLLVVAVGAVWPEAVESLSCYSCSGETCVNGIDFGAMVDCNGVQDQCYTKFNGCKITDLKGRKILMKKFDLYHRCAY